MFCFVFKQHFIIFIIIITIIAGGFLAQFSIKVSNTECNVTSVVRTRDLKCWTKGESACYGVLNKVETFGEQWLFIFISFSRHGVIDIANK
jgi:hypothetical protein